jgi:bifunctional UDP-N-acetylglucosamine pyrophosphorylase/glucosamine-1-phosphate N-acetyltransferase
MGINCYSDLVKANQFMRKKICENLTNQEVKIVDPGSTFIDWDVKIGKHTVIYPFTIIDSGVKIGKYCSIGPFCHLRPGTTIKDKSQIGNFSELVRSKVGNRTKIKHFSYIGDARIGQDVNIGAGTVTANFDGKKKNITIIKDRAFIGSDTVLVAPVKIGKSAVTGAGCAVTKNKNVPDGKVVTGVPARILNKRGK